MLNKQNKKTRVAVYFKEEEEGRRRRSSSRSIDQEVLRLV
jgi:hypothetical protein